MQREILFRGKRIDTRQWVIGSLIVWPDGDCEIAEISAGEEGSKFTVDPETVGQFIGLGNIYEGDIVNDRIDNCIVEWNIRDAKFNLAIIRNDEEAGIRQTHKPMPLDAMSLTVTGTIHDRVNPA